MKKRRWVFSAAIGVSVLFTPSALPAKGDGNPVDPRLAFFREYIREITELHQLREQAAKELAESPSADQKLATMVRVGTRYKFQTSINMRVIQGIELAAPCKSFADGLRDVNQLRWSKHAELVDAAKELLSGPKPGVDYGTITARVPEISAELEQVDRTTFTIAPATFLCLVDPTKVNGEGKVDRLIVDRNERRSLVKLLNDSFGASLNVEGDADSFVSAAKVLKHGLEGQQWKATDDR
ncbi:hypothetical protein ACVIGB_002021 [Bradyrhizobium sp. USDA 4341]